MMRSSLRQRLLFILLGLTLLSWVLAGLVTVFLARELTREQIERQLNEYMDIVQHSMAVILADPLLNQYYRGQNLVQLAESGIRRSRGFGSEGQDQAINLWFDSSQVVVGTQAPVFPPPTREGFVTWEQTIEGDDAPWSVLYRAGPEHDIWLAVGVNLNQATQLGLTTIAYAVLPLLVVLPLSVIALLWGVQRGLVPLNRLAASIEIRQPQALDPIDSPDTMTEVQPVVTAINRLLERLCRALESERRFTANAAHELQTPLAAIKAEVQRYQRQVDDESTREMLVRISERVHRATDTVTQLLTLARLDPDQSFDFEAVDLQDLLIDVVAQEGSLAVDRQLDIQVPEHHGVSIQGNRPWLQILVRNLLINAFRHASVGGAVQVSIESESDSHVLLISNDCAPIPSDQWQCFTQRFYTSGASGSSGVGLGLSIAQRVVDLHGAQLRLSPWNAQGGFLATVVFHKGNDSFPAR
jgi:signal transduction histidine kinase